MLMMSAASVSISPVVHSDGQNKEVIHRLQVHVLGKDAHAELTIYSTSISREKHRRPVGEAVTTLLPQGENATS
jgi:hypothetical protein